MSRVQSLVTFASWNYGAQLVTVVLQFGYAAVTSRLVDGAGFGVYAVALAVAALIALLVSGGLGQTVGRMRDLAPPRLSALTLYALALGAAGSLVLLLSADLWALVWGMPAAAGPIRVLAVSALFGPAVGLLTGLLRRQQRFRGLAVITVAANVIGVCVGVAAVALRPGPIALLVSPTVALIILGIAAFVLNRSVVWVRPDFGRVGDDLRFSWKVTGLSLISYANWNMGRWAISRGLGADALGQWNRAEVLTAVPLEQAHSAVQQAIYPEFRHDIGGNSRTKKVWTDMLVVVAWAAFPLAGVASVVAPVAIPILFGPGWDVAAALACPIALIVGVQMISTTLGAALEAVGRFRWILATHLVVFAIQVMGAALTIAMGRWLPVLVALAAARVAQHVLQVAFCGRAGYLDTRTLLIGYGGSAGMAAISALSLWTLLAAARGDLDPGIGVVATAALVLTAALSWRYRHNLPPVKILKRYRAG